jgi:hypothetical protein
MDKINDLLKNNEKILDEIAYMLSGIPENEATKTERRIMWKLIREGYGHMNETDGQDVYTYPF